MKMFDELSYNYITDRWVCKTEMYCDKGKDRGNKKCEITHSGKQKAFRISISNFQIVVKLQRIMGIL